MLKTRKGVAKRFKFTKRKKIKYYGIDKGHLLTNKSPKRLRKLRRGKTIGKRGQSAKYLKRLLPYG